MWPTDIEYVIVSINVLTAHKSIQHMHISIYKNNYVTSQYLYKIQSVIWLKFTTHCAES
jgi:hypothetical protein